MSAGTEQHLPYRSTADVVVLDGDGSRWVRERGGAGRDTRVPYRLGTDHYCEFEYDDDYVHMGDEVEVFWDAYDGERSCVGWLCSVDYGEDGFVSGAFLRDEDDEEDALYVPCGGVFFKPEKGAER